ncbi:PhzF family phenazine biosynthesis protein [Streptomyces sp. 4N509B]|uniref:PhzF family phenazine biosynthesis protein n=1 Tax=Streptomyces sp. 4N509B TaxID=3457413 RepID=UPI003FCFB385
MEYSFFLVDVFTERRFGGNQLAVLTDARGLTTETMQAIAREFNFSETTFVLPPEGEGEGGPGGAGDGEAPVPERRLRIFTPASELPFAGHPTVGTAAVLAATEEEVRSAGRLVLREGVGPVPVEIDGTFARFTVTAPYLAPDDGREPSRADVAAALALPDGESGIVDTWYGGVGVGFCFVRLADAEAVDRIVVDRAAWAAGVARGWSPDLYVFAPDADGEHVNARSFPLAMGIDEDPATGAASAGLVASLAVREGLANPSLLIEQGVRMGRPSLIEATAHTEGGRLTGASVGGHSVIVGNGTISV